METKKKGCVFLVLVPHRDFRAALQKQTDSLVNAGLKGVYTFPLTAPLAKLSEALNAQELKDIAKLIRLTIGKNKLYADDTSLVDFFRGMNLFGVKINLNTFINPDFCLKCKKITSLFNPPLIGTFLLPQKKETPALLCDFLKNTDKNALFFRAAAIANMTFAPVKKDEIFFKWKIDKLSWLPKN